MKKVIVYLIILISVSTIAYAGEKPLHTGKNLMKDGPLDAVLVQTETYSQCYAVFADDTGSIGGEGEECSFHLEMNKNKIIAWCICPYDISQQNEQRSAEVGYIPNCYIQWEAMPGEQWFAYGTGFIITAADEEEELGGRVTMICKADLED